jgi:hypothetical protein
MEGDNFTADMKDLLAWMGGLALSSMQAACGVWWWLVVEN